MSKQDKLRKLENRKNELIRNIQLCEDYKKKIINFVQKLNYQYDQDLISYEEYYDKLSKALKQRRPEQWIKYYDEWIDYYNYHLDECEEGIRREERKIKVVPIIVTLAILVLLGAGLFFLKPTLTGFVVGLGEEIHTQNLSLIINESSGYEWQLEHIGILKSAKMSGRILGNGSIKVYLEDKLMLDSSQLELNLSGANLVTGLAIGELVNDSVEKGAIEENTTNITEPVIKNITNTTEPTIENITESENITQPINLTEIPFKDICIETCSLNLNKTSYELRFEIENAVLELDNISYTIKEIIPESITLPEENITIPTPAIENVSKVEELIQRQAEINKPVKWIKKIKLNETANNLTLKLPQNISNVKVWKVIGELKEEIGEDKLKIREAEEIKSIKESLITGYVVKETQEIKKEIELIIEDTVKEVEVEYETEAPQSFEEDTGRGKIIVISGPDNVHYENVLAYTETPKEVSEERIRLYRTTDVEREQVQFTSYDNNNNSLIDKIEWVVPSLSNRSYELEIVIYDAEHLNKKREFIANIYEYVNETDSVTYTIPKHEYVRAYFERNLTNENIIDIYVRNTEPATIEVYEKDSDVIIGSIEINSTGLYIIELDFEGSQSVFDLKSIGKGVVYDYIHDANEILNGVTMTTDPSPPGTIAPGGSFTMSCTYSMAGGKGVSEVVNIRWQYDNGGWTNIPVGSGDLYVDGGQTNPQDFTDQDGTAQSRTIYGSTENTYSIRCEAEETSPDTAGPFQSTTSSVTVQAQDNEYPQFSNPTETPSDPATYSSGQTYQFNITITSTNGTAGIEFNGTNYTLSNISDVFYWTTTDLAVGAYNYYYWAYGNGSSNNFNNSATYDYTVSKAVPQGSISGTSPIDYGTAGDVEGTETNNGDGDVIYKLYREGIEVSNPDATVLGAGIYNYIYNATSGQNYTDNSSIGTFELTVNQIASSINLTLNNSQSNITITQGITIDLNCSALTGDLGAYLALYREGSLINNGTSPIGNTTIFNTVQLENITCYYQETQNYTTSSETWWVNVTEAANQAPTITDISDIPDQSITEAGVSYVEFSVLASDENGVGDLNDNSLNATFSKAGETTRTNSSCSWISDINITTANYTCTIGIWYWDGAGTLDVNATILDLSNEQSPDYNETFTLSETTAMVMSPTSLDWATLYPGDLDKLSTNDPIVINNTGNKDITSGNVRVKAYDLTGETNPDYTIPAANFTVNVNDACEGTQMQNNTAIGITNSILSAGNNSAGQGQEELYFCLEEVPNIIQQAYSTVLNWIIDII